MTACATVVKLWTTAIKMQCGVQCREDKLTALVDAKILTKGGQFSDRSLCRETANIV